MSKSTSSFRTLAGRLVQKNVQSTDHLPEETHHSELEDSQELVPPPEFYLGG